jgi:hypothetical protein
MSGACFKIGDAVKMYDGSAFRTMHGPQRTATIYDIGHINFGCFGFALGYHLADSQGWPIKGVFRWFHLIPNVRVARSARNDRQVK